jgi:quercetin dioxygenase-like cupin family protein
MWETHMHSTQLLTVSVLILLGAAPSTHAQAQQTAPLHHTIVPLTEEGVLKGMQRGFEIVSGDPDKADAPFVIRIYNVENQVIPPHWHPEDEHLTVVKGTWAIGRGDTSNAS